MTQLSFKDVGILATVRKTYVSASTPSVVPIGVKTPLEQSNDSNLFVMNISFKDQIGQNLTNLISTNYGERLAIVDFGANLLPLVAEYSNKDDFDQEAMARIKTAVSKWMPYVELEAYESKPNFEDGNFIGEIDILILYSVSRLNIKENMVNVKLRVM